MIYEVLAVEVFLIKISVCIISISLLYQRNDIQSVPDAIRRSKCPANGVKLSPLWPTSGTSVDTQYTTIRNVAFHQFHRISPYIRTNMASKIVMTEHLKSMTPIGLTTFPEKPLIHGSVHKANKGSHQTHDISQPWTWTAVILLYSCLLSWIFGWYHCYVPVKRIKIHACNV
jgi:hypothetical protein